MEQNENTLSVLKIAPGQYPQQVEIGNEVLAVAVTKAQPAGYVKEWKINGEAVTMGVEKKGE